MKLHNKAYVISKISEFTIRECLKFSCIRNINCYLDDVFQNVFLSVCFYQKLPLLAQDDKKSFAWLKKVVKSKLYDYINSNKKIFYNEKPYASTPLLIAENQTSALILNERKSMLNLYISRLAFQHKRIGILYFNYDLKYDEISKIVSVPRNTVAVTINRLRTRLKAAL